MRGDCGLPPHRSLELDDYVPIQFQTFEDALGFGHLRLGNYQTTLLELIVEPRVQTLRGLTLTSFEVLSAWPELMVTETVARLPTLDTEFDEYDVVSLEQAFQVSARNDEVLVWWAPLQSCVAYGWENAAFLVCDGVVSGAVFGEVKNAEARLTGHTAH